ncbi:hypothetical protein CHS0354_010343 [Potamilus streckersoni]|uniref:Protein saal1 n=1 Tax=Potamilus streckersoni TaxID=2493646 RepID=A0AAE0TEI3_9BIVA|nr:hypothetical protein CHS0354_010343 [Potamilus streckersoni]
MDSPSQVRNPSPPPELTDNPELLIAESIGNTAFSKHWFFTTLLKLIEEVDRENEETESELVVDVDEDLQNELCKLWDMSMNSEVTQFLLEFKAVEILTGVIEKSKAPRVTEISVGILCNMACDSSICQVIANQPKLIELILLLLESSDAPTLVETTRFLFTCVSNPSAQENWIKAIREAENFQEHIQFIFQSSTNCDLLKNTAELVHSLLDIEGNLCETWATQEFVQTLLEAVHQIGYGHSEALEIFLHIFQLISTTETGVEALVSCAVTLQRALLKYLNLVCEYEIVRLKDRQTSLASALSVLNLIFTSVPLSAKQLTKDEGLFRVFLKILEPLYPKVFPNVISQGNNSETDKFINASDPGMHTPSDVSKDNTSNQPDHGQANKEVVTTTNEVHVTSGTNDEEADKWMMLFNILSGFLGDYLMCFVQPKDSTEEEEKVVPNLSHILTYLDESCSRCRTNFLILTLCGMKGDVDFVDRFKSWSEKFRKKRLMRIIKDVMAGKVIDRESKSSSTDQDGR